MFISGGKTEKYKSFFIIDKVNGMCLVPAVVSHEGPLNQGAKR